jgi:hypothetical protein
MGVLKRKQESEAITFKLPAALKREIEQLRTGPKMPASILERRSRRRCGGSASRSRPSSKVPRVRAGN